MKQELQHFIATACMLLAAVFSKTKATAKNGEQQVPLADPFILCDKGVYYAYGTGSDNGIPVYISRDLKNWKSPSGDDKVHLALDKRDSYGNKWFWAPEVYLIDGTYYMYYSAEEHICVATSESPLGPFRQKEKRPMIEGRNIDNSLFIDSNGQAYLFWVKIDTCNATQSGSANSKRICKRLGLTQPDHASACPRNGRRYGRQ